jgi:glycosyltransferase involved in cell wall biosynthesis
MAVHVIVPDGVDDPATPSGGNTYDRRICLGLGLIGWSVHEHAAPGTWPRPHAAALRHLSGVVASIPDGAVVLVDGLIASTVPDVLVPQAARLRLVVLVHMPLGTGAPGSAVVDAGRKEGAVLAAAVAVVTTSLWTRRWLLERYGLRPGLIHVAEPGVDAPGPSPGPSPGTAAGSELLCVAAVIPGKGHDLLLAALAAVADRLWRCRCVGPLTRDPGFVDDLRRQARADGIGDRVSFCGPRSGAALDVAYRAADVLVLASRAETYGMVVAEAVARALPVIAPRVGGVPEALGRTADGSLPGLLVSPGDATALAAALRDWLDDAALRQRLRAAARQRSGTVTRWSDTSARLSRVLAEVAG